MTDESVENGNFTVFEYVDGPLKGLRRYGPLNSATPDECEAKAVGVSAAYAQQLCDEVFQKTFGFSMVDPETDIRDVLMADTAIKAVINKDEKQY